MVIMTEEKDGMEYSYKSAQYNSQQSGV